MKNTALVSGTVLMIMCGCAKTAPPAQEATPSPEQAAASEAAAPKAPPREPLKLNLAIKEDKLDNGMKVLVIEDHSAPVVTVQVWYRVGSRNEHMGVRGMAHLLEHMMFKGTPNVAPEEHARIIDSVGGEENAFTSEDVTAYHDTVPVDRMELAMELEAERMTGAKIEESLFFKEREVVKEEIRVGQQNNPIGALLEKFRSVAYEKHPYNWTVGGTLEDLDNIKPADIRQFYETYYKPNNAVLIVVGDTTLDQVKTLGQKHFGAIPAGKEPPAVTVVEPEQKGYRRQELKLPTQLPIIIGGYKTPAASSDDSAVLEVAQMILGAGNSSRLHKKLVRDEKVAVFAAGFNWKMKDPGLFLLLAGYMPFVPAEAVEKLLIEEVDKLAAEGPTEAELDKAKNMLTAQHTFELTSLWQMGIGLGQAEVVEGDYHRFSTSMAAYDKVTIDDVKRVAGKYLTKERLTLAVLTPAAAGDKVEKAAATEIEEAKGENATWPTAERYLNLKGTEATPVNLPPITRKTLANGLRLLVVERREQPVVYFDLKVPGGNLIEPKGKAGAAALLAEMLTHGTKTRSADQIAQEVEGLGGSIQGYSDTDYLALSGQFLARDFQNGLQLFADSALNPTFPEDEMGKAKQPLVAGVRMTKDDPNAMAKENLSYAVYGYDNPKGRPASEATLTSVTTDDLKALYKLAFAPKGSLLTVVGDVDGAKTAQALEAAFGAWSGGGAAPALPADPQPLKGAKVRLIDKPDLTQSSIALGHLGIDIKDPDYLSVKLGNYVLGGGGFSSRLMKTVRSKGGKTYGIRSKFEAEATKGLFSTSTFTRTQETNATINLIFDEIKAISKKGITKKELQAAKNNLAGSYAITLQEPKGMGMELSNAEFYGLGEDWVRNYRLAVTAPTLKQVNAALKKHLNLKDIAIVVVGKGDELNDQVAKFGTPEKVNYLDPVPTEERSKQ